MSWLLLLYLDILIITEKVQDNGFVILEYTSYGYIISLFWPDRFTVKPDELYMESTRYFIVLYQISYISQQKSRLYKTKYFPDITEKQGISPLPACRSSGIIQTNVVYSNEGCHMASPTNIGRVSIPATNGRYKYFRPGLANFGSPDCPWCRRSIPATNGGLWKNPLHLGVVDRHLRPMRDKTNPNEATLSFESPWVAGVNLQQSMCYG